MIASKVKAVSSTRSFLGGSVGRGRSAGSPFLSSIIGFAPSAHVPPARLRSWPLLQSSHPSWSPQAQGREEPLGDIWRVEACAPRSLETWVALASCLRFNRLRHGPGVVDRDDG